MNLRAMLARAIAEPQSWLRAMTQRSRLEDEMEAELAHHLENLTADLIREGHSPSEAGRRARIAMGSTLTHKEAMRASLGLRWWDELVCDLRYATRVLRKNPGFTMIAITSLALAIGANTTIFSVAKDLLYDRLDVPHPEGLSMLRWTGDSRVVAHSMWGEFDSSPGGGMTGSIFSDPVYRQMRDHDRVMQGLLAFKEDSMNATVRGTAQRVTVAMVSGNYYSVLEVRPQIGRAIEALDEAVPGAGAVAVISDGLWERQFDRSPAALGRTIKVNNALLTIVGVNPKGFTGAKNVQMSPEIFVPLSMQPVVDPKDDRGSLLGDQNLWWLNVVGRIRPGISASQAQATLATELDAATRGTMTMHAGDTVPRLVLADGSRGLHFADGIVKKPVYVLLVLTGLVLLLACANIATLLLARGAQRQREMSVRLALGAGRVRILRQLLTESLLLAALGGAGGLLLGYFARNAIPRLMINPWERIGLNTPFDWGVFAFCCAVTLLTGVLFGFAPAWLAAHTEVSTSLKESAQNSSRRRRGLNGKSIVAFQIALSTLLVVGAGLFVRTILALNEVNPGFNPDHLVLFEVQPPAARYGMGKDVRLHERLEQRIAALPGVESVTLGQLPYIANSIENSDFLPADAEGGNGEGKNGAEFNNVVGVNFFQTMEIRIVAGRSFGPQDTATSPRVGIINQALARKRFPDVNPIGKRFKTDPSAESGWIQIVGICADTRYSSLFEDPPPQFFLPYVQQTEVGGMVYQVRTRMSLAELAPALRRVVQSVDRDLPVVDLRTQREQIDSTVQVQRALAALTAGFGLLALALACVGVYGIMAYSVAQRRNEIGIRLALGAEPAQVRNLILRESTWIAVGGIVGGLIAALMLTRLLGSLLYGVGPYDPLTLFGGALLLLLVALAAAYLPARRAMRVDPVVALRCE
jgi:predicted permease